MAHRGRYVSGETTAGTTAVTPVTEEAPVTGGVITLMIGAVLTFAVKSDNSVVDLQILGIILMIGGGALIYHGQQNRNRVREVTTIDDLTDPDRPTHVVREELHEDDPYEGPAENHARS